MTLPLNTVIQGGCLEVMREWPEESIDLVMFSPPYWGLRNYDVEGQIGLEDHPNKYIAKIVEVCDQVKRILKKTGSMYIVLGDTYYGSGKGYGSKTPSKNLPYEECHPKIKQNARSSWLQPKQLLGIPWHVAIALQEDAWLLRNDIIWHKPNAMPSSVKDRLSQTYEHIFHFVKNRKYYYDLDVIREKPISVKPSGNKQRKPSLQPNRSHVGRSIPWKPLVKHDIAVQRFPTVNRQGGLGYTDPLHVKAYHEKGKNPGDVILTERESTLINFFKTKGSGGNPGHGIEGSTLGNSHPKGKNPGDIVGYNSKYFEPHGQTTQGFIRDQSQLKERQKSRIEAKRLFPNDPKKQQEYINFIHDHYGDPKGKNPGDFWNVCTKPFKGAHFAVYPEAICVNPILSSSPQNGTVLDPLCGSGTTCLVAKKLGRNYVGIEINPAYVTLARKRLEAIPEKLSSYFT